MNDSKLKVLHQIFKILVDNEINSIRIDYLLSRFELENVKLTFKKDAVTSLAREAIKRKTGARGLRSIIENSMLDIMYEIPSDPDISEVEISKETILHKAKPKLTKSPSSRIPQVKAS